MVSLRSAKNAKIETRPPLKVVDNPVDNPVDKLWISCGKPVDKSKIKTPCG